MDGQDWVLTTICLTLGALIQSVIGFGMGLVVVPLLVFAGIGLPVAIGVLMPNVLVQTLFCSWQHREELAWRDAVQVLLLGSARIRDGRRRLRAGCRRHGHESGGVVQGRR